MFDLRYKTLENFVDEFVICESKYDHKGKEKKLSFKKNNYNDKKINYIVLDKKFSEKNTILDGLNIRYNGTSWILCQKG